MRIGHFSDCHVELRQPEIRKALEFIADDAAAHHVDLLVDAGDWWDGASRDRQRNDSTLLQQRLRHAAPLLAVVGNHGSPEDLKEQFTSIEARHPVHVSHKPEMIRFRRRVAPQFLPWDAPSATVPSTDLLICTLPWLKKAALVDPAQLAEGQDLGEAALAKLRDILDGFAAALAAHDGPALVVAHADVAGRTRSAGAPPETGDELVIPAAWLVNLDPKGRAYIALGHEHDAQAFADWCRFSGTPAPTTYGESKPKSYCLVDLAADLAPVVEERRTPVARLVKFEATWEDGGWRWEAASDRELAFVAGAKVRFRYHFLDHERAAARAAAAAEADALRAAGAIEVALDPKQRQILRRRVEEGALTRARSTRDKVHVWYQHIEREEGLVVPALQKDRIDALLATIERETGIAAVTAPGVAVQFEAIRVRGIGPFRDMQELRLADLGGRLVAFVGENGAGKSTFLGMAFALLYHAHPDGWQLVDRAHGKDALVEGDVRVVGGRYTLRLKVNGASRKMEGYVLGPDGRPVNDDVARGLTSAYDRWIAERFPSKEVARATLFAGQKGTGDLLDATAGKRREALVTMLGQSHLQRLGKAVGERLQPPKDSKGADGKPKKGLREVTEGLRGELRAAEAGEGTRAEVERLEKEARVEEADADAKVGIARYDLAAGRERLAAWEVARAEIVGRGAEAKAKAEAAKKIHDDAHASVGSHQQAVEEARKTWRDRYGELQAAEQASEAAAQLGALEEKLARAVVAESETRAAAERAGLEHQAARDAATADGTAYSVQAAELSAAADAVAAAAKQVRQAEAALVAAQQGAARLAEVQEAVKALPAVDLRLAEVKATRKDVADRIGMSQKHDAAQKEARRAAADAAREAVAVEQRGQKARERVADVPCGGPDAQPSCEFLKDAAAVDLHALAAGAAAAREAEAKLALVAPPDGYLPENERAPLLEGMDEAIEAAQKKRDEVAAVAALLPEITKRASEATAASERLYELRGQHATAEARHADALRATSAAKETYEASVKRSEAAGRRRDDAAAAANKAADARTAAEKARDDAKKAVERAGELGLLRERVADADAAVKRAEALLETARATLTTAAGEDQAAAAARAAIVVEFEPYKDSKRPVIDEGPLLAAQQRHTDVIGALARAQAALDAVRAAAGKAAELRAAILVAEQTEEDHEVLLRALSPTGIQALEIDQAAPEIAELVNRLLEGSLGDRFTFLLDTKERGADGKEREGLPLLVLDATREESRWEEARTVLSGGEGVLVGWALRLAVAIYANQQAGVTGGDIFGDEPGAGLRGQNGRRFVGLLRRAVEIGEMDRICWIPEEGAPLELADVRVLVGGGRVCVEGRGEAAELAPLALEAVA